MKLREWIQPAYLRKKNLRSVFLNAEPYAHLSLSGFFTDKINAVAKAVKKERFIEQNSDLYQFQQSNDLKKSDQKIIAEFHAFFSSKEFLDFMSKITGKSLKSIDMSAFIYDDTDYLLTHDDRLSGRKIAYIVQLGDNFEKKDGGALQLFEKNKIVKSIYPKFNTFSFFEVSPKSLHQVEEVKSNKKRISVTGWFHG